MKHWALLCGLALFGSVAGAQERIEVCYNYGCLNSATVTFSRAQLAKVRDLLDDAVSAAHERELIGVAVGRMLGWAGKQSPIHADRGGNYADDGVYGRMDCIDHATTTTRLLRMLERRGWLRWHRVLEPEVRRRLLIFDHWSAVIEEAPKAPYRDDHPLSQFRYAVDSWFYDNGEPAVVLPLDAWMDWEGPRVE